MIGSDLPAESVRRDLSAPSPKYCLKQGGFGRNRRCYVITNGQFSFIDWLDELINLAGADCEVVIGTWTAAVADMRKVEVWLDSNRIKHCRWVIDPSFETRHPKIYKKLTDTFGHDAIRAWNTHAKFALVEGDGWKIIINTSANLNSNKRCEYFSAEDNPTLYDLFLQMVTDIFELQKPGIGRTEQRRFNRILTNKDISKGGYRASF